MTDKHMVHCPFCGHDVELAKYDEDHVICSECGVTLMVVNPNGSRVEANIKGSSQGVSRVVSSLKSILKTISSSTGITHNGSKRSIKTLIREEGVKAIFVIASGLVLAILIWYFRFR